MLGIGGNLLVWIRELLIGQTMHVKIAENMSSLKDVSTGVPQGSVLGPVLFLFYVNYIGSSAGCCWKALVDDLSCIIVFHEVRASLCCRIQHRNDHTPDLQNELKKCVELQNCGI